jgi:2-polyprenyl-3-methyl-5-hydroxy-6-metoxy-1,4-benzoquinol methylase
VRGTGPRLAAAWRRSTATLVPEMAMPYGQIVARTGLSEGHRRIVEAVPPGSLVLDIGCSTGYVAAELVQRGCRVIGFDSDAESAKLAEAHCERVIVGTLESRDARAALPRGVEVVILGEVLEHTSDPLTILREMHELIVPGGRVIVSIPNVGVWFARMEILRGRFPYADSGIFDRTHLRFFTRATLHDLVRDAGFEVVAEHPAAGPLPLEAAMTRVVRRIVPLPDDPGAPAVASDAPQLEGGIVSAIKRFVEWVRLATLRARPELFAGQFVLELRPARGSQ